VLAERAPDWALRAISLQLHAVIDFAPFVAGAAAWMGSRDGRRNTRELVAVTPAFRWRGDLAALAAATGWAEAAYLGCVAATAPPPTSPPARPAYAAVAVGRGAAF
jgi:hypothetical protein